MSSAGPRHRRQSADPHHGVPLRGRPFQHSQGVQGNTRRVSAWIHPGRNHDRKSQSSSTNARVWRVCVFISSVCLCGVFFFLFFFVSWPLSWSVFVCDAHPSFAAAVGWWGTVIYSFLRWTTGLWLLHSCLGISLNAQLPLCDWLTAAETGSLPEAVL